MRKVKVMVAVFFWVLSLKISYAEGLEKSSLCAMPLYDTASGLSSVQKRPFALKTNLLYWAAAIPNLSIEFYLFKRLSLNTEVDFAWWSSYQSQFYWQLFAVSPELRYRFCKNRSFQGHYVGAYVSGGLYDIMLKPLTGDKGYQGEFYLSAGVSYGYAFSIGKHLSLEAGFSLGYVATNYREYVWGCSEYMRTDTKRSTWIGPTKINLTLVW